MDPQRRLARLRLRGALFVVTWGALAWYQFSLGHTVIATLVALPVVAVIFWLDFPGRGPGHFAFTRQIGAGPDESLTLRQRELQAVNWWLVGSCLAPLGALLAFMTGATGWFEKGHAIYVVFGGLMPLVGVACFLKAIGAFFRAWRAH